MVFAPLSSSRARYYPPASLLRDLPAHCSDSPPGDQFASHGHWSWLPRSTTSTSRPARSSAMTMPARTKGTSTRSSRRSPPSMCTPRRSSRHSGRSTVQRTIGRRLLLHRRTSLLRAASSPRHRRGRLFYPYRLQAGTPRQGRKGRHPRPREGIPGELLMIFGLQDPHVPAGTAQDLRCAQRPQNAGLVARVQCAACVHA